MSLSGTVALIEAYYWRKGKLPETDDDIFKEFLEESDIEETLANKKAVAYLIEQGVPVVTPFGLQPKMMRWIQALCTVDGIPLSMKQKSAGVTSSEHAKFMRNPLFCRVLRDETQKILPQHQVAVHNSLAKEASRGNVQAIKLYMEVTGETTQAVGGKAEVNQLMSGILEILQTHVAPNVLNQVAEDFEYLLVHGRPPALKRFKPVEQAVLELKTGMELLEPEDDLLNH